MFKKSTIIALLSLGVILVIYILFHMTKTGGAMPSLTVTSTAFSSGNPIPTQYSGAGSDVSPQLSWAGVPANTQSIVVICDDPDAPGGTWVHWVVYNLPASVQTLDENADITALGGTLGKNSFDGAKNMTYGGPYPPKGHGPHHYYFKVFALSKKLDLPAGANAQEVEAAMKNNMIAHGELIGTFERK